MSQKDQTSPSFWDELKADASSWWRCQPDKLLFFVLLGAWVLLFHLLGNITFGYVKTPSLFGWMHFVYSTSEEDQLGLYVPFVVLLFFWWKRKELMDTPKGIWSPALGIIVFALALHLVGYLIQQTRISIVAFFIGIYGLMGLVWGREFLRRTFFPMLLFVFCVPLGSESDRITLPLRLMASKLTYLVANGIFGIPIVQEGNRIFDPSGRYAYEVAAACSGIKSLSTTLLIATAYAFFEFQKSWKRMLVVFSAFPAAIAANLVRLLLIIFAAELFGQEAGNYVHENGWISLLPYIPAMLTIFAFGYFLRDRKKPDKAVQFETSAPVPQ